MQTINDDVACRLVTCRTFHKTLRTPHGSRRQYIPPVAEIFAFEADELMTFKGSLVTKVETMEGTINDQVIDETPLGGVEHTFTISDNNSKTPYLKSKLGLE